MKQRRLFQKKNLFGDDANQHLGSALKIISSISEWKLESINTNLLNEVKSKGFKTGDFFMDLRISILKVGKSVDY